MFVVVRGACPHRFPVRVGRVRYGGRWVGGTHVQHLFSPVSPVWDDKQEISPCGQTTTASGNVGQSFDDAWSPDVGRVF